MRSRYRRHVPRRNAHADLDHDCSCGDLAGIFGILLGAPTLRLRGDYLAIVTLGFGEIIRVFLNNLDHPVNITNGPKGLGTIDSFHIFGMDFGQSLTLFGFEVASVSSVLLLVPVLGNS